MGGKVTVVSEVKAKEGREVWSKYSKSKEKGSKAEKWRGIWLKVELGGGKGGGRVDLKVGKESVGTRRKIRK